MSDDTHSSLRPYREVVDREGATFGALLWHSPQYQRRRFEVFAESVDLTGLVVADIGCGRGDFLTYLNDADVPYGGYVGVDGIQEMVAHAQRFAEQERFEEAAFIRADFASDADLFERLVQRHGVEVFAFSGSLNTFAETEARMVLERAWAALCGAKNASGSLMFNFLSDCRKKVDEDLGPAKRFGTASLTAWALEHTPRVILRTDYLPSHDATLVMFAT